MGVSTCTLTIMHTYVRRKGEGKIIKDNSRVKLKRSSGQERLATSNRRNICCHRFNILFYSFLATIDYPKSYHCHIFKRSRDDIHRSFLLSKTDEHCCILHSTSFGKKNNILKIKTTRLQYTPTYITVRIPAF